MWVAAIDFQKPFDSIQHDAIRKSLRNHSTSEQYICLLKKLYADQRATVWTDVESIEFEIARRAKQRDPESSFSIQFVSPISNGEGHWYLERKGLGHQIERREMRLHGDRQPEIC